MAVPSNDGYITPVAIHTIYTSDYTIGTVSTVAFIMQKYQTIEFQFLNISLALVAFGLK